MKNFIFIWLCLSVNIVNVIARVPGQINEKTFDLIVLHNNDMHSRFDETNQFSSKCQSDDLIMGKCYGGFARVSEIIQRYRKMAENGDGPRVLYLNAGDTYMGTPWFTLYRDKIVSEFMNLLKPDAAALGNHEFDLGLEGLIPFLNDAEFPVLVANLNISMEHPLWRTRALKRSAVFNAKGFKVGVIGYLLTDTKRISKAGNIDFQPEISAINEEAELLDRQGVKVIIALGHSGYDIDIKIAKYCPLVDLVVGGHSNTFLYTGKEPDIEISEGPYPTIIKQLNGKKVPVVQAYAFTKYMGKLEMSFDDDGNLVRWYGQPILLDATIPRDPQVLRLLDKYRPAIDALSNQIVGETKTTLDRNCRESECNFGNLITDAFIRMRVLQYDGPYWTDAPIALINGGAIRASAPVGNISKYDLITILPFNNTLRVLNVTGHVLKLVLEQSFVPDSSGRGEFLQVSGLHILYDPMEKNGQRIKSVNVLCSECPVPSYQKLDIDKQYGILTTSFVYNFFKMLQPFKTTEMDMSELEATMRYIETMQTVYPGIEGRFTALNSTKDVSSSAIPPISSYSLLVFALTLLKFYF